METMEIRRDINVITEEIKFYKARAGESILEIGKRLNEAKEQLAHGEWMDWLRDRIDFSDATAQRFMRLAREYENPSPVTELGASKALVLLALPSAEREEFLTEIHEVDGEEKTVAEMSKRELEAAVRERKEALDRAAAAEAAAAEARRIAEANAAALKAADERAAEAQREADDTTAALHDALKELAELRTSPTVLEEEPGQQTLEAIRKEAAAEAKKAAEEKLKKKLDAAAAAKAKAEEAAEVAAAERDRVRAAAEAKEAEYAARLERVQKQLAASGSEAVTIFKTHFEQVQSAINAMLGCIAKSDADVQEKLSKALRALCEKTVQSLPEEK